MGLVLNRSCQIWQ